MILIKGPELAARLNKVVWYPLFLTFLLASALALAIRSARSFSCWAWASIAAAVQAPGVSVSMTRGNPAAGGAVT